jgi:hypothetical protein
MKTPLQTFIELAGDKLDCRIMQKVKELLDFEKECVVGAYEAGMITSQNDLKIEAVEYFKRFYSDPNENSNARIDMLVGGESRLVGKRKRKRIS